VAQGRTISETMQIAQDVAKKLIESYRDHGDPLPGTMKRIAATFEVDLPVGL
jgi:predicted RNase H-like HicB family nuclease